MNTLKRLPFVTGIRLNNLISFSISIQPRVPPLKLSKRAFPVSFLSQTQHLRPVVFNSIHKRGFSTNNNPNNQEPPQESNERGDKKSKTCSEKTATQKGKTLKDQIVFAVIVIVVGKITYENINKGKRKALEQNQDATGMTENAEQKAEQSK